LPLSTTTHTKILQGKETNPFYLLALSLSLSPNLVFHSSIPYFHPPPLLKGNSSLFRGGVVVVVVVEEINKRARGRGRGRAS